MSSRRRFIECVLCAAGGLIATGATAQTPTAQTPAATTGGVKRTIVSQIEGPMPGYMTVLVEAEIEAGATVARHTHPGVESTFVLEGEFELLVDGQPNRMMRPGTGFQIPTATPHSVKNGPKAARIAANYVVEKGKPLASPV